MLVKSRPTINEIYLFIFQFLNFKSSWNQIYFKNTIGSDTNVYLKTNKYSKKGD
jgi:hypothetical protein